MLVLEFSNAMLSTVMSVRLMVMENSFASPMLIVSAVFSKVVNAGVKVVSSMMTSEAGKAFKAMYAGKDGSAMTKADLQSSAKYSEAELRAIWGNLSVEEQSAFGSFETMLK
jgi:hypothetical protein